MYVGTFLPKFDSSISFSDLLLFRARSNSSYPAKCRVWLFSAFHPVFHFHICFPLGWQLCLAQRSLVDLCSQLVNLKPCFRLVNNLKLGTNRFSFSSAFVPENFWTFLESLGIESVQSSVSVKWPSECCVTESCHLSHSLTKFLEPAHAQLKGVSATM